MDYAIPIVPNCEAILVYFLDKFGCPPISAKCDVVFVVLRKMKIHASGPVFADESPAEIIPSNSALAFKRFINLIIERRVKISSRVPKVLAWLYI